jgi:MATE family multidrug resistance protein
MDTQVATRGTSRDDAGGVGGGVTGWTAEARAMLALAWPIALTNLSQFALAITDALFLGRLGTEALAAATLGANLYWALLAPGFGLALAAAPLFAQSRGRAGPAMAQEMRQDARAALWACGLATLPAWTMQWHTAPLLIASGQEPELAALAQEYVRAMMWGLPLFCGFVVLRGFLAAEERPGPALVVSLAGILLNVPLNWVLIHGHLGLPAMGVAGAGWASTLSNAAMLAGLLAVIARDRHLSRIRLLAGVWRPAWAQLREVLRIGLPIAGSMALEISVFATAALAMGWFGAAAVAAHAIAVQLASLTFMVPMGLGQAATARVGLAVGAARPQAAARAGWVAVALGAGFMAAMALLLLSFPRSLAWLFLDATDPGAAGTAALAAVLLMVAGVFQLADGVQAVASGALRGLKDTRRPMLIAALGYWVIGLPGGLVLAHPLGLGPVGIWLGLAAGLGVVAALMLRRWARLSAAEGSA